MSRQRLEVAGLRHIDRANWTVGTNHPLITWWPASLPGSDFGEPRRRPRKPAKPRIRRGRIQLVAA